MSSFYLELNPIVSIGKKLPQIISSRHFLYTSVWSISELLIELNERTYTCNKTRLKTIVDSKIPIDWEEPTSVFYSSFGIERSDLNVKVVLLKIIEAVIESKSYSEFENKHPGLSLELQTYRGTREISRKFITKGNEIIIGNKNMVDIDYLRRYDFSGNYIDGMAGMFSQQYGISKRELLMNYNGRLEHFINALKMITVNMDELDKNDLFDAFHLLYIQNNITYLVSNDSVFTRFGFQKRIAYRDFSHKLGFET